MTNTQTIQLGENTLSSESKKHITARAEKQASTLEPSELEA